jgi:anti-sigma factor RsiW
MIEGKYIELLQADVDGELPDARRAELSRFLLAHPEARTLRAELAAVCGALESVTPVEPPADLLERVLAALPPPSRKARQGGATGFSSRLRWAAAVAAATLVGAIVFRLAGDDQAAVDVSNLYGTMASQGVSAPVQVDQVTVSLEQVHGTVSLLGSPQARFVEFDLAVDGPVEVVVEHDGARTQVTDLARPLVIAGPALEGGRVTVEVLVPGAPAHRFELEVPASR